MKLRLAAPALVALFLLAGCSAQSGVSESVAESAPVAGSCELAMQAAAAVPLDQTNDEEFGVTLVKCGSLDEWVSMLKAYPEAGGMSAITDADVPTYLEVACWHVPSGGTSSVCEEGRAQGVIS